MASGRRIEKIENLLREVVAEIVSRDIAFREGILVTVTRAKTSEDLLHATIYVSVLAASEKAEEEAIEALRRSAGEVQHTLNRKLRMRPVPRIVFESDLGEKQRERIEKLLGKNASGS